MPNVCRAAHTRACQSPRSCSVWGRRGSASTHVLHPYTQFPPLGGWSGTGHPVVYGCRHISQRGPFIRSLLTVLSLWLTLAPPIVCRLPVV